MKKDGRPITTNSFTGIDEHEDSAQWRGKIPLAPRTHSYPEPIRLRDLLNSACSRTEKKINVCILIKSTVKFDCFSLSFLKDWLNRDTKLNVILRWHITLDWPLVKRKYILVRHGMNKQDKGLL